MRWNCPHCQTALQAPIESETTTKKTYVRCGKCGGASLIHRSAAVIEAARARRREEMALQEERKARIEAEARIEAVTAKAREAMNEAVAAAARATAMAAENATNPFIRAPARANAATMTASGAEMIAPPRANATLISASGAEMIAPARAVPPPFSPPKMSAIAASGANASAAGAPTFAYSKPPAFLMAANETHSRFASNENDASIDLGEWDDDTMVEVHCGTITDNAEISSEPIQPTGITQQPNPTAQTPEKPKSKGKLAVTTSNLSVWIAAALALASGIYLIHEGRKTLAPAATMTTHTIPASTNAR
jgi:hypothetical protein